MTDLENALDILNSFRDWAAKQPDDFQLRVAKAVISHIESAKKTYEPEEK